MFTLHCYEDNLKEKSEILGNILICFLDFSEQPVSVSMSRQIVNKEKVIVWPNKTPKGYGNTGAEELYYDVAVMSPAEILLFSSSSLCGRLNLLIYL